MVDDATETLEWNIGSHRIKYIGEKTSEVRESFDKAIKHKTEGRVRNYFNNLETLYFDIRQYIDSEDQTKDIEDTFNDIRDKDSYTDNLEEIKELDKKIQEIRLDLGLDIPSKTSPDSILD